MNREELQSRRAYNQIWNGAGRYDLHPEEAAFDDQGDAELYINTIMGLAYGLYDFSRFQPMLHSFQLQQKGGLYTDVFWLGMEHAVFARAGKTRPALAGLRREYAQRTLARPHPQDPRESAESLRAAWARRILAGEEPQDPWLRQVLAALEFDPGWNEQKIIDRTEELLFTFFRRARRSVTDRQWAAFAGRSIVGKGGGVRLIRPNALRALGRGDPSESGGVGAGKTMRLLSFLQGKTPEPILRRYVEDCFGTSMLTPSQLAEAERELCTGVHRNCRLHFTRGTPPEHPVSADAAWDAESFQRQREKNRAYYQKNLLQNRLTIAQLTQKLQNTLLLQQDEDTSLGRVGRLRGDVPGGRRHWVSSGSSPAAATASPGSCPWIFCWTALPPKTASRKSWPPRPISSWRASAGAVFRCGSRRFAPSAGVRFCGFCGTMTSRRRMTGSLTMWLPGGTGTAWRCGLWPGLCARR